MSARPGRPSRPMATLEGYALSFVTEIARRGCRVRYQGGGTCRDRMDSARAARDHGVQPAGGPRWGSEGATGAWRDKVAAGYGLCRGCRASLLLDDGEYVAAGAGTLEAL